MTKQTKKRLKKLEVAEKASSLLVVDLRNLDKFKDKLMSWQVDHFSWTIHLYRGTITEEYLILDLYCHCELPNWSCESNGIVGIGGKIELSKFEYHFKDKKNCLSIPTLIKWNDLVNPDNGHVIDGRVMLDVTIREVVKKVVKNAAVIKKTYPGIADLELLVGKSTFRVNRELLAHTSVFFNDELKAGRLEGQYKIEEITPVDFQIYLDLVYNPKQYFSSFFAKDILQYAVRFANPEVVMACQNVLMQDLNDERLSMKDRTKLADVYDTDTVKKLFNADAVKVRANTLPRFMVDEKAKAESFKQFEKMRKFMNEQVARCCDSPQEEDEEEEEEEEDIDQSIPSTSGMVY